MFKKTQTIIGAALLAQSFLCFVLSLIYMKTKKDFSKTCAILGLVGGVSGGALLFNEYRQELQKRREFLDDLDYSEDELDDFFCEDDSEEIDCSIEGDENADSDLLAE